MRTPQGGGTPPIPWHLSPYFSIRIPQLANIISNTPHRYLNQSHSQFNYILVGIFSHPDTGVYPERLEAALVPRRW
ncbi:MAG: hypothetical protein ACE14V_09550 [bacterium]